MDLLGRILPDSAGRHRVCGRECSDGSPCQNMVDRPGDACWIDSHRPEDPRVDGGPTSPEDVPLSDMGPRFWRGAASVGSTLGFAVSWWFGLGRLGTHFLSSLAGIAVFLAVAFALDAYQRRALSEGENTGQ